MINKINITVKVYTPLVDNYYRDTNNFRTKNYAAERAAEIYPHLRELALDSLKGVFNQEELELLIRICDLKFDPKFVTSSTILQEIIEENIKFLSLEDEERKFLPAILEKIQKIDSFRVIVFTEWLTTFLSFKEVYKGGGPKKSKSKKMHLENYVKKLL